MQGEVIIIIIFIQPTHVRGGGGDVIEQRSDFLFLMMMSIRSRCNKQLKHCMQVRKMLLNCLDVSRRFLQQGVVRELLLQVLVQAGGHLLRDSTSGIL